MTLQSGTRLHFVYFHLFKTTIPTGLPCYSCSPTVPSFKSDSSFFHKIAMGAIGSRAVKDDLAAHGHVVEELERGSLDAKIWKGVKRKRVRIPDLVCVSCGQRIEVRAKGEPKLSMSHSPTIPERRWDYGMVGDDLIAIPVCTAEANDDVHVNAHWTRGVLTAGISYWNEKEWVKWRPDGAVNYFAVQAFRDARPDQTQTKGAEEGSETTLSWRSCFAPCDGTVTVISDANITVENASGEQKRRGRKDMRPLVAIGDLVRLNQVLACNVTPRRAADLKCGGGLTSQGIFEMLRSQHLPVRFAGVKLARVRRDESLREVIEVIAANTDEDIYVRLEAKAYLAAVHAQQIEALFAGELSALDKADQLEAVIAIGEVGTESATILADILGSTSKDYFLRSAAAYCLGRIDSPVSRTALVKAFTAQTHRVREDALAALADVGFGALAELLEGVNHTDEQIQAGCAEVLRWLALRSDSITVERRIVPPIAGILSRENRSLMAVWLGGQLPEPFMQAVLTEVLGRDARLAYSLAVSWAFARSWIAPVHDSFRPPKQ